MFIVIEGCDGAGTTMQTRLLAEELQRLKIASVSTAEPSTGPIGNMIRQALSGRVTGFDNNTLAALFAADRLDHAANTVCPSLDKGKVVISDRHLPSSLAYQCEIDEYTWVMGLNAHAPKPDLTFYLRVDVGTAVSRVNARSAATGAALDSTEQADKLELRTKAYDAAMSELVRHGYYVRVIDGTQGIQDIHKQIRGIVLDELDVRIA